MFIEQKQLKDYIQQQQLSVSVTFTSKENIIITIKLVNSNITTKLLLKQQSQRKSGMHLKWNEKKIQKVK